MATFDNKDKGRGAPANDYATRWECNWSAKGSRFTDRDLELLTHVNCSYLSGKKPPTLLALKQHAQSLVNLIRKLSPSTGFNIIDFHEAGDGRLSSSEHEAFDWLNNLSAPYTNNDDSHNTPLWNIINTVKKQSEIQGLVYHCPLETCRDFGPLAEDGALIRPFRNHHSLAMHANECLEILDHEYSATGGLLSLLPYRGPNEDNRDSANESEDEQTVAARNSLLGQWLFHSQFTTARMHELEIHLAKALDLIEGEAIVPAQLISDLSAEVARNGRACEQDKFIIANCGDNVRDSIHEQLDKAEAIMKGEDEYWHQHGVASRRVWKKYRNGEPVSRGLVHVDGISRFYRVKGFGGKSTIFMVPLHGEHPKFAESRNREERPAVVSTATPLWPERVTSLEKKYREKEKRLAQLEFEKRALLNQRIEVDAELQTAQGEVRRLANLLAQYQVDAQMRGRKKEKKDK